MGIMVLGNRYLEKAANALIIPLPNANYLIPSDHNFKRYYKVYKQLHATDHFSHCK